MNCLCTSSIAGLAWFLILAGGFSADDLLGKSMKGISYADYDSNGQLKMEVAGAHAQIMPDNLIKITSLKMTFHEEGKAAMDISTPLCFYDRVKKTAVSTAEVCLTRAEIKITGTGFDWNEKESRIRIKNNARVILQKAPQKPEPARSGPQAGAAPRPADPANATNNTIITSSRLTFDQKAMVALFEGKVSATDPALKIESERLTVSFSNDKKVELIEAEGGVVITRDAVRATAKTATYAVTDGKITLSGKPLVIRQKDSLAAETIVLWRNSSRIICEPNAQLTIYSEQETRSPLASN